MTKYFFKILREEVARIGETCGDGVPGPAARLLHCGCLVGARRRARAGHQAVHGQERSKAMTG